MKNNIEKVSGNELMKDQITGRRKLESSLVLTTLHEKSYNVKSMICRHMDYKTQHTNNEQRI